MKRFWIIGIIVLAAVIGGYFYYVLHQDTTPIVDPEREANQNIPEEGGPEYDPVSVPALVNHKFDGRDLTLGQVLDDNSAYTRYYITYMSGALKISGIMNVPKGTGPFPVLILNHGHIDTTVYTNGRGLKREQDYLARRGYVVIHPDYRNHAQSDKDPNADLQFRLGYAEDVINAVYAVKNSSLPYFIKDKIGMLGHSMGGGVTLNTIVSQPDLVGAAVLFAPVSVNQLDNFQRWTERRPELAKQVTDTYGTPQTNEDFWHDVSAINFLDRIKTPILLHHGTADDSVPIEWSADLDLRLKALNKNIIYDIYEGQPHEFTTSWGLVMQRTVDFFDQYLK